MAELLARRAARSLRDQSDRTFTGDCLPATGSSIRSNFHRTLSDRLPVRPYARTLAGDCPFGYRFAYPLELSPETVRPATGSPVCELEIEGLY